MTQSQRQQIEEILKQTFFSMDGKLINPATINPEDLSFYCNIDSYKPGIELMFDLEYDA